MELFTISIILLMISLSLHLITKKLQPPLPKHKKLPLPPGPHPWPLIGNIPNLIGKNPHITAANLAKSHGPLISLRLGSQLLIMGSSPLAASQILKTHDRRLSARYTAKATPIAPPDLAQFSILWAPHCGPRWRALRAVWGGPLFGAEALRAQAAARERKAAEMVAFLKGREGGEVRVGDVVFAFVYNVVGNHCFSQDMVGFGDGEGVREWKGAIWEFMEAGTTPTPADFFPAVAGLGMQWRQRRKTMGYLNKMFGKWEGIIRRREEMGFDRSRKYGDFLEFMMESGFSRDQMLHMLLEIFPAACGNLTATTEWAMAELMNNKAAMNKLVQELNLNPKPTKLESETSQLPYLSACIKETLRLHPPIAFAPHLASASCEVMGYAVPAGALVMVNLWALGRDAAAWPHDPSSFRPERFLGAEPGFGFGFEFVPFGAGRRMCPGLGFAEKLLHLAVGNLVGLFEWKVREGGEVEMGERYGVPVQMEKPLVLVPWLRP